MNYSLQWPVPAGRSKTVDGFDGYAIFCILGERGRVVSHFWVNKWLTVLGIFESLSHSLTPTSWQYRNLITIHPQSNTYMVNLVWIISVNRLMVYVVLKPCSYTTSSLFDLLTFCLLHISQFIWGFYHGLLCWEPVTWNRYGNRNMSKLAVLLHVSGKVIGMLNMF